MSRDDLLKAILDDDSPAARQLLRADQTLATGSIREARLYKSKILHWIYAKDTPLHLAAAGYRADIVRLLLAAGADPNSRANMRESRPLHYAADACLTSPSWNPGRQVQTLQCLLEAGAEINAPDKNGATALHRATRTRAAAGVRFLLNSGCNASLKNKPGSTAFHLAVQNTGRGGSGTQDAKIAQRQIIQEFLSHGLSVNIKDGRGKSVLDCATSNWIRELLQG